MFMGQTVSELLQHQTYVLPGDGDKEQHQREVRRHNNNKSKHDITKDRDGRQVMNLSSLELTELPANLSKRRNMNILKLNGNYLKTLPHLLKETSVKLQQIV